MSIRSLPENFRQIAFAMIPFVYLGGQSASFALNNQGEALSKYGAVIVVWALVNMSISRYRYANSIADWEQSLIWKYMKYYETTADLKDEALDLTFDLHACQIAQISLSLGYPNPFVEADEESVRQMCRGVEERLNNREEFLERERQNHRKLEEFKERYRKKTKSIRSWENYLWKIEIGLACWGTLQNAFGTDIVNIIHS